MGDDEAPPWVVETQQTLGTLIKRPKLTDALLQKPPFRFLHDVVSEVTKETGFAAGLYTEENEVNSARIKDKESKIGYLTKIIKCVEFALGITLGIRVGKIVAGMEAENTNAFLQQLFHAATTVPDSSGAVNRVLDESAAPAAAEPPPSLPPPPPPAPTAPPAGGTDPTAAAPDRGLDAFSSAPMRKPEEDAAAAAAAAGGAADEGGSKRIRPKSARRPPPRVTSNEVKVDKQRAAGAEAGAPVSGVIMEGGDDDDDAGTIEMVDTAGDAVNTSSMARGGAHAAEAGGVQGRLMKNLLDAKHEMEATGAEPERPPLGGEERAAEGGIILGKKSKAGSGGGKLPSKTEVSALRQSIQTLCQSSNPLGRCLEYVQEDLEAMGKELESWRAMRHRRAGELADEEATTASALVSLKAELEKADELIREKQTQIRFAKASILRNDQQVERLLSQVVSTSTQQ
jgi:TRAF3-interacting protein 1